MIIIVVPVIRKYHNEKQKEERTYIPPHWQIIDVHFKEEIVLDSSLELFNLYVLKRR